jgi:hypothetical protein
MTAVELLAHLESLGISVVHDQAGMLQVVAPTGTLPLRLRAQLRGLKAAVIAALQARTVLMPDTYRAPEASIYRRWVTGGTPGAFGTFKLETPKYQTTRYEPVTYWGLACTKKACAKSVSEAGQSERFFPSDTCVSCWNRWDKTTREEVPDAPCEEATD